MHPWTRGARVVPRWRLGRQGSPERREEEADVDVERAARHAGLRAQMSEERDTVQRARERLACIEIEVLQPGLRLLGARRASIVRRRDVGAVRFADLREREYSRGARELDAWSTRMRWTRSGHARRERLCAQHT